MPKDIFHKLTAANNSFKKSHIMIRNASILLFALLFIASCNQRPSVKLEVDMGDAESDELQITPEVMNDIIMNIASPIELASLISSMEVPFSSSYLADPGRMLESATSYEMAFNLGALSADLGYLNMYERTETSIEYLSSIKRLADELNIGQFLDVATIKRLAINSSDLDSLMFISINSFNNMEGYLRESGQSSLSALMITGVWLESLYLATQVSLHHANDELRTMIGEQKLILTDLLLILHGSRNKEVIRDYVNDLEIIKGVYEDVMITYEVGEPETVEVDGMLMVVQSESSNVEMSDETLQKITQVTRQVRNMLMKIKS